MLHERRVCLDACDRCLKRICRFLVNAFPDAHFDDRAREMIAVCSEFDIEPLKPGRIALHVQAAALGVEVPVGKTVAEIKAAGFDVDPDWAEDAVIVAHPNSPTGYAVGRRISVSGPEQYVWALST